MAATVVGEVDASSGASEGVAVEIKGVHKWFGEFYVLRDVDLSIRRGERIVICGPSGSGKSTLLRCINGLEPYQRGEIVVDGIALGNDPRRIAQVRREVGMVFQQFNLFPHLTVLENCMLAPRPRRSRAVFSSVCGSLSRPTSIRVNCRADSSSVSRSHVRCA
jgi:ABC-type Fe3+/spermidine/putrescine transport system ATPase subunit